MLYFKLPASDGGPEKFNRNWGAKIRKVSFNRCCQYPIPNTEGKQCVYLRIDFFVKFGAVILRRLKRLDHSTFLAGYWIFGHCKIATAFKAGGFLIPPES